VWSGTDPDYETKEKRWTTELRRRKVCPDSLSFSPSNPDTHMLSLTVLLSCQLRPHCWSLIPHHCDQRNVKSSALPNNVAHLLSIGIVMSCGSGARWCTALIDRWKIVLVLPTIAKTGTFIQMYSRDYHQFSRYESHLRRNHGFTYLVLQDEII